jgi:hypothetical protein
MAAQLGEWVVFGTKHYEQALHNRLSQGDEIRVEVTTKTPVKRLKRVKRYVVTLGHYSKDYFFGVTETGVLEHFEWRQALEFKRVARSEAARA